MANTGIHKTLDLVYLRERSWYRILNVATGLAVIFVILGMSAMNQGSPSVTYPAIYNQYGIQTMHSTTVPGAPFSWIWFFVGSAISLYLVFLVRRGIIYMIAGAKAYVSSGGEDLAIQHDEDDTRLQDSSIPPKILWVEDDAALAGAYQTRSSAEGFDAKVVGDGEQGLVAAIEWHPNLIVTGVMMPKLSGFEMIKRLKDIPETRGIKVLIVSAIAKPEDIELGKKLGAVDYIDKHAVTIGDTMSAIKTLLAEDSRN